MNDNYLENIKTEDELFDLWKKKPLFVGANNVIIDHGSNVFVSDGIVNNREWNKTDNSRILFVLKEAHSQQEGANITKWLSYRKPKDYKIWKRVVEWTYGITNTTINEIPKFSTDIFDYSDNNIWLNGIAMLNIKKSNGKKRSSPKELKEYAKYDKKEIIKQIELINPKIIICGNTGWLLDLIFDGQIKKGVNSEDWYYFAELFGERRIILDYYHPANQKGKQFNYEKITSIYQQALKVSRYHG